MVRTVRDNNYDLKILPVGQETQQIDDPRATGVLPKDVELPHAALAE